MGAAAGMTAAGLPSLELRQSLILKKVDVLADGALSRSIHLNALGLELDQSPHTDAAHRNRLNLASSKSLQGLTHAVGMVQITVLDFLDLHGLRIDNDKTGG